MKVLLEYLVTVIFPLDDLHLPLAILRTDQFIIDKADPPFAGRERNDQAPPEMRLGRRLMEFVHSIEVLQHPRSSSEDIVYFEVLLGGGPFRHSQIASPVYNNRINDLIVITAVA